MSTIESLIKTKGDALTDAGENDGARGSSWVEPVAGETVAVVHVEPSKSVVIDNDVVGVAEQRAQGSDDSRVCRRTVSDCTTMSDEVTIIGDASITDDETVVIGDATVADKSTTDGDRGVVGGVSQ